MSQSANIGERALKLETQRTLCYAVRSETENPFFGWKSCLGGGGTIHIPRSSMKAQPWNAFTLSVRVAVLLGKLVTYRQQYYCILCIVCCSPQGALREHVCLAYFSRGPAFYWPVLAICCWTRIFVLKLSVKAMNMQYQYASEKYAHYQVSDRIEVWITCWWFDRYVCWCVMPCRQSLGAQSPCCSASISNCWGLLCIHSLYQPLHISSRILKPLRSNQDGNVLFDSSL